MSLVWNAFARALDAKRIVLTEILASEIKDRLAQLVDQHSTDLAKHSKKAAEIMPGSSLSRKSLEDLRSAALDRISTEIDYALLKQSTPVEPAPPGAVNIYQTYGIVQTGSGGTATFIVNLGDRRA